MTKRKILAVATLAALPLFIGAPRSVPEPAATPTEVVHRLQAMDGHARPQWMYVWGMQSEDALAFGVMSTLSCSFFGPVGGIACGTTAEL